MRDRTVVHFQVGDGQRSLPSSFFAAENWHADAQLVVDGYEQLSPWSRWRLKRRCRRFHCGLLITTHDDAGLPTIFAMQPTLAAVERLVARLLDLHGHGHLAGVGSYAPDRLAAAFDRHQSNVRELLFELYDLYESEREDPR